MFTYLAIVMTYLSISITGFLITIWFEKDSANNIYEKRKKENDVWKKQILEEIQKKDDKRLAQVSDYLREAIVNDLVTIKKRGLK